MKVLRVRRGFTTNSSASSEWVPPQWTPGSKLPPPPGTAPSASGPSFSGSTSPSATQTSSEPAAPLPQSNSNIPANGWAFGGLLGMVALVIAIERLMRRVAGSRKHAEVDDD